MANRVELSRLTSYSVFGKGNAVSIPRLTAYLILDPGDEDPGTAGQRQSHVYAQILRRG
jgi:hypothetical protein